MRINALGNTATDFASDDYIAIDGTTNGSRKMKNDSLLKVTAQSALSGKVALAFVPNNTNALECNPYVYEGSLYVAKEDYNGPWDSSKFYQVDIVDYLENEIIFKTIEKKVAVASGNHLSITYSPILTKGTILVDLGENIAAAHYGLFAIDSSGTNPQLTLMKAVPTRLAQDYELPSGYDTLLIYTSGTYTATDEAVLYRVNRSSVEGQINRKIDESSVVSQKTINQNSHVDISFHSGKRNFKMLVSPSNDAFSSFRIYYKDSTGTNANDMSDSTNYSVGVPINVSIPSGYDVVWLWTIGLVAKGVEVSVYDWQDSLGDKVKRDSERLLNVETDVNENFNEGKVLFSGSIANGSRLDASIKSLSQSVSLIVEISSNYYQYFRIYFKDSTGTNPNDTSDTNKYTTEVIHNVTIPSGYDTIWIFNPSTNKSGSAADVSVTYPYSDGLCYKLNALSNINFLRSKKVMFIGDSITEFNTEERGYVEWVKIITGADSINAGVGGTRYAPRSAVTLTPSNEGEAYGDLDIYNRVHAWCENDYQYVDAGVDYLVNNNIANPTKFINAMKNNPVGNVDVVVLFAGTNDWASSTYLGDSGTTDITKTLGALNKCIQEILTANPKIKLFVITPIVRYISNIRDSEHWSDNAINNRGLSVKDEAKAIYDESILNKIPVLDAYNTLGWNQFNFSAYFLNNDGTHPYKGWKSLATRIVAFLQSHFY